MGSGSASFPLPPRPACTLRKGLLEIDGAWHLCGSVRPGGWALSSPVAQDVGLQCFQSHESLASISPYPSQVGTSISFSIASTGSHF